MNCQGSFGASAMLYAVPEGDPKQYQWEPRLSLIHIFMKSHTSLVAQQTRLSEWADMVRDCQNRPQGMKIDEWCQLHDITKAKMCKRDREKRLQSLILTNETDLQRAQSIS